MRVDVLGPIRVESHGAEVELGGPQQRLVLAVLAAAPGRVVTTDQLVDRIWGEAVPDNARKTIQVHVSKLRKAFADPDAIETSGGGYRLRSGIEVDAVEFERLATDAHQLLGTDPVRAAALLGDALELWRGPPFADIRDEDAVHADARRLEELRLIVQEDRLQALIDAERAAAAVAELESLLDANPTRERLRALYMLALYRTGRQAAALAAYQDYRKSLAEEHGLDPSEELARLELQILQHDPALGPTEAIGPGEGVRAPPLPADVTSFVGRSAELAEVAALLERHRLVTLTGSGGVGKTRLAVQLGRRTASAFPHGVWFVELAGLADPDLVADEVAGVLGADPVPDAPTRETIEGWIGGKRLLLILDNCEHLVEPVARLATYLLESCAGLRILATSRERLAVPGEAAYRLPSLAVPEIGDPAATAFDSVRLFADRAAAARPGYSVGAGDVDDVVAVCGRLDGIPLAIELAAARVGFMSPAQIAARLDERFTLLVGPKHAVVDRQQTLRTVLDWSYELLDDRERLLFRRLSVFAGGFGLEAAEAVCSADPLDTGDVLDLLTALVDKSMVHPEDGRSGQTRFRLLETIRHYAAGALAERGAGAALRARHLGYHTELCEHMQAAYRRGDLGQALAMLEDDEDNVRAALRFALDHGEVHRAARIVGAIGWLWYNAGVFREGIEWCRQVFATEPDLPDGLLASALHAYGTLLGTWEQPIAGAAILERQVELRRKMGDPVRLAAALNNLGNLWSDLGRTHDAERVLAEATDLLRAAGEAPSLTLVSLGTGHLRGGNYETAEALYAEALAEARAADDTYATALATVYLGQCAARLGRLDQARRLLEDARARFAELGVRPGVMEADLQLAIIDRDGGGHEDAARRLLAVLETPDAHWYLAAKFWVLQVAAGLIGDQVAAAQLLGAAHAYYEASEEVQPAFVLADLAATTERRRAGDAKFATAFATGRSLAPRHAVATGQAALNVVVAAAGRAPADLATVQQRGSEGKGALRGAIR